MTTTISLKRNSILASILIDGLALVFIFFVPAIAHLFNFPVYMIEPMRVMLVLSLVHSSRWNSYLLALALPLFSYLVSGHPFAGKMLIITAELLANVFLFYLLAGRLKNLFVPAFLSILVSKLIAYLLYLVFFSLAFVMEESEPLFLAVQLVTTLIFSGYIALTGLSRNLSKNAA